MAKKPQTRLQKFSQYYNWMRGQLNYKPWERAMMQGKIELPKSIDKQRRKLNKEYDKFAKMIDDSYQHVKAWNFGNTGD